MALYDILVRPTVNPSWLLYPSHSTFINLFYEIIYSHLFKKSCFLSFNEYMTFLSGLQLTIYGCYTPRWLFNFFDKRISSYLVGLLKFLSVLQNIKIYIEACIQFLGYLYKWQVPRETTLIYLKFTLISQKKSNKNNIFDILQHFCQVCS